MTAVHEALTSQVQLLRELSEQPGRMTELVDVDRLSLATGIPVSSLIELLNGGGCPEASVGHLHALLKALRSVQQRLEAAQPQVTPLHNSIRCGRHLPPGQLPVLAAWVESLLGPDAEAGRID